MADVILEGRSLTRRYRADAGQVLQACCNIDIKLYRGETLGIVGESGCGKSTLLRMLAQLEPPDEGKLFFHGREITTLSGEKLRQNRRHIQMVFQNSLAAFGPRMKAGAAIAEPIRNFEKISRQELRKRQEELLEQVNLPCEFLDRLPHSMSGGQCQRLGIARALALNPEILICDEATASLDVLVQDQIIKLLLDIQKQKNLSLIFVSHDLALVGAIADRIIVMYLGCIVEILPGDQLSDQAAHPYTKTLLEAVFSLDMEERQPLAPIIGEIPSPLKRPPGCPFHTRCRQRMERCQQETPVLTTISDGHQTACHLYSSPLLHY